MNPKVTVRANNLASIQAYARHIGLQKGGPVQAFIDSEVARLSDPFVPSDTSALRKSVFEKSAFGSGEITYSIYGNKAGRNTWNDTASRFQDAPKRGPFWVIRAMEAGGYGKLMEGIRRYLGN